MDVLMGDPRYGSSSGAKVSGWAWKMRRKPSRCATFSSDEPGSVTATTCWPAASPTVLRRRSRK